MAVKIRLQRHGRKQQPFYHIVIADARSPRDGRFIERIGYYNPLTVPASIELDSDRAFYWLMVGAQPTDTVHAILRHKGVMLRKHLEIGVRKGAVSREDADARLNTWLEGKEQSIQKRREQVAAKKAEFNKAVFGVKKERPVVVVAEPEVPAVEAEETPAATEE